MLLVQFLKMPRDGWQGCQRGRHGLEQRRGNFCFLTVMPHPCKQLHPGVDLGFPRISLLLPRALRWKSISRAVLGRCQTRSIAERLCGQETCPGCGGTAGDLSAARGPTGDPGSLLGWGPLPKTAIFPAAPSSLPGLSEPRGCRVPRDPLSEAAPGRVRLAGTQDDSAVRNEPAPGSPAPGGHPPAPRSPLPPPAKMGACCGHRGVQR